MSWERDPLWAKARLYFERAFNARHNDELFGLWWSFGLELLARAAVASVSPTLLAEPAPDQRNLLHALGRGTERPLRRSINTTQVLKLCQTLFEDFVEGDFKAAAALVNRRNDELHTGTAAFVEYPPKLWLSGCYRVCRALTTGMGESLESLFGEDEAKAATEMLEAKMTDVLHRVQEAIAAHRRVFNDKPASDRQSAAKAAETEGARLALERHHRVKCPACDCFATVQGETVGPANVEAREDQIEIRQAVSPRSFGCSVCGLKLQSYAELDVAGLGGHYTRTTTMSPDEFYGLTNLDTFDAGEFVAEYLARHPDFFEEYDNE